MPELPEVETVARGLAKHVTGDVIESVWLGSKPEPLKSPAGEIVRTLEGARVGGVRRVGKHIVIDLDKRPRDDADPAQTRRKRTALALNWSQWIVHLGVTGQVLVCKADEP